MTGVGTNSIHCNPILTHSMNYGCTCFSFSTKIEHYKICTEVFSRVFVFDPIKGFRCLWRCVHSLHTRVGQTTVKWSSDWERAWFREGVWLTASLGSVVQTCHHAFVVVGVLDCKQSHTYCMFVGLRRRWNTTPWQEEYHALGKQAPLLCVLIVLSLAFLLLVKCLEQCVSLLLL